MNARRRQQQQRTELSTSSSRPEERAHPIWLSRGPHKHKRTPATSTPNDNVDGRMFILHREDSSSFSETFLEEFPYMFLQHFERGAAGHGPTPARSEPVQNTCFGPPTQNLLYCTKLLDAPRPPPPPRTSSIPEVVEQPQGCSRLAQGCSRGCSRLDFFPSRLKTPDVRASAFSRPDSKPRSPGPKRSAPVRSSSPLHG